MKPELGQRVISIAHALVGSHYINGGYGATPGQYDGCPCRPGGIDLIADEDHLDPKLNSANKPSNLAVNAATMKIKTYCVCAGNYYTAGGSVTTETAPDLIAYLDSLKGAEPSSWRNYNALFTPRRAFGPGQNGGDGGGKLVWGRSCKGVRHFDCVGFVSYCYWKASGAVMQLDIKAWRRPAPGRQVFKLNGGEKEYSDEIIGPPGTLMDGDILIKADHHIGLVSADGTIVEAQDTHLGVRETPNFKVGSPGAWTHLVRLGGGGSAELAWPMGWWRVWDGGTWYYYLGPDNVVMSSKSSPFNTRTRPAHAHNTGNWVYTAPKTLVITWKQVAGAPKPCVETFYNAGEGCEQMNATSNLYSPLVATRMV
jgi:hypothetical protein